MSTGTVNAERKIRQSLLDFGRTVDAWKLIPALNEEASKLIRSDPFSFALAACLDRGVPAEVAWTFPYWIKQRLGHLDPRRIAQMNYEQLSVLLDSLPRRPRYRRDAPRTILELSHLVAEEANGDTAALWTNKSANEVERYFKSVFGVGPGIASMVVVLLEKCSGINFGDLDHRAMDVKPDVHVIRVLSRLGLMHSSRQTRMESGLKCKRNESEKAALAIEVTRRLNPDYPAELDTPLWIIGREKCHANGPSCQSCPMEVVCPREGV